MSSRRLDSITGDGFRLLTVKVKPRSSVSQLMPDGAGAWVARLKAAPVDGKANAELVALVARHFGCSKAAVSIMSGASGRTKIVKLTGVRAR